jgi:hypothetical protein
MYGSRGVRAAASFRVNALFHGQVPNEAVQFLPHGSSAWAGRGGRCAGFGRVRSVGEYPGWTRARSKGDALMVMAADYPFVDVLWSMIVFFFWVIWIWIVITVLVDVFRVMTSVAGRRRRGWSSL